MRLVIYRGVYEVNAVTCWLNVSQCCGRIIEPYCILDAPTAPGGGIFFGNSGLQEGGGFAGLAAQASSEHAFGKKPGI